MNTVFIETAKKTLSQAGGVIQKFAYANVDHLKTWSSLEKNLSPEERKTEKQFFISTIVLGSLFFVSASSATYLEYQDLDFWPKAEETMDISEDILLAEEGFFGKASIPTVGDVDRSEISTVTTYEIQPGDSLDLIAAKFGIRVRTLTDNNEINDPDSLTTGDTIKILPVDGFLYTIKSGDTLSVIAKTNGLEEEVLKKQNRIDEDNGLVAGKSLILPGKTKPTPVPVVAAAPVYTRTTTSTNTSTGSITKTTPTIQYTPPTSGKKYSWPVVGRGEITQYYRYGHYGIDIWGPNQPGIKAIGSGVVTRAIYSCGARSYGCGGGYGNVVVIDHGNGVVGLYAHNSNVYVSVGERVSAGQVIAKMGNSGNTRGPTGIHLHFELSINGRKVNPLGYL